MVPAIMASRGWPGISSVGVFWGSAVVIVYCIVITKWAVWMLLWVSLTFTLMWKWTPIIGVLLVMTPLLSMVKWIES